MTENNAVDLESTQPGGVSRRTVTKAMAWAVPAIAVAATVPSAVASPSCLDSGLCFGCAVVHKCCSGGPSALYWACVSFTNDGPNDVEVSFDFVVNTSANGDVPLAGGGLVPAGETVVFRPETPRQYGNCSAGTYNSFTIEFSDGINSGSAIVPGGNLDGGGNTCPDNTPCPVC